MIKQSVVFISTGVDWKDGLPDLPMELFALDVYVYYPTSCPSTRCNGGDVLPVAGP